jgi:hypothetical protein
MPDINLRVPAFCPVCDGLMKGKSTFTFYDYGCCIDCYIFFIEGRVDRWKKDGWRPSPEEIETMRAAMKV